MNRAFVPESVRELTRSLDAASLTVLSDLARLFVCMRWAETDAKFLASRQNNAIHFVVDADVAFNWANPNEERSMMKFFDNETIAVTLSEMAGNWLFLPNEQGLPPTRMYQGHANEINNRVGSKRNEYLQRISDAKSRISLRDRPLSSAEQIEIERFIERAEGFAGKAEVAGLSGSNERRRDGATPEMKLAYVLTSPRVRPMSREWLDSLTIGHQDDELDVSALFDDWYRALPQDSLRDHASETDAGALAYVGTLDQLTRAAHNPARVVLLCGSHRVYRAWSKLKRRDLETSQIYLRHPLCFLFTDYALNGDGIADNGFDASRWTAYRDVFTSFLQRLELQLPNDPAALFDVAYFLAWVQSSFEGGDSAGSAGGRSRPVAPWIVRELEVLRQIGEPLATAQALSFRAQQAVNRQADAADRTVEGESSDGGPVKLSAELQLLTRLRYIEASAVDALLEQLISGVLAQTLPTPSGARGNRVLSMKVPILVFGPGDTEVQEFAIKLRSEPEKKSLTEAKLGVARNLARQQKSRYLALVLDALILAAFGEWAAAASMSRRAIERAEFFQKGSGTRVALEQAKLNAEGKAFRNDLFRDTIDVDGREARYLCAQAIRRSAHSLHHFEEADSHLRAFEAIVAKEKTAGHDVLGVVRAQSESLALELAQWAYLRYQRSHIGIGQLTALTKRLEALYVDMVERQKEFRSHGDSAAVDLAVLRYIWEQTTVHLGVVLVELKLSKQYDERRLVPADMLCESLARWVFSPGVEASAFARFIATVACLTYVPDRAAELCHRSTRQLFSEIGHYVANAAIDGVPYERSQAHEYKAFLEAQIFHTT